MCCGSKRALNFAEFLEKNTLFRWKEEKTNTSRGGLAFLWLMRLVNLLEAEEKV
jgi:hypothetical protein